MANESQANAAQNANETPADESSQVDQNSGAELDSINDFETLSRILDESQDPELDANAAAASAEEGEEESEEVPEEESESEEETPAEEESEEPANEEEPEDRLPKNFRFRAKNDQQARLLRLMKQYPDADPIELAKLAGYKGTESKSATQEAAQQKQEQADPFKETRDKITATEAELARLKTEKAEHRKNFEWDKADEIGEKILELTLQLRDERQELTRQESDYEDTSVRQTAYDGQLNQSKTKAVSRYPDTGKQGTRQAKLVAAAVALKNQQDPEFFHDPNYPNLILDELEKEYPEVFVKKAGPGQKIISQKNAGGVAKQPIRAIGKGVPANQGSKVPITKTVAEKAIENMSLEELRQLSDQVGSRRREGGNMVSGFTDD